MAIKMIARGRHISTAALIWTAAVLLVVADVLVLGVVPGHERTLRTAAWVLAVLAGFLLGTAALRAVGSLIARFRIRRALRPRRVLSHAHVHAEAQRGIAQFELYLAEQHSRDA